MGGKGSAGVCRSGWWRGEAVAGARRLRCQAVITWVGRVRPRGLIELAGQGTHLGE